MDGLETWRMRTNFGGKTWRK